MDLIFFLYLVSTFVLFLWGFVGACLCLSVCLSASHACIGLPVQISSKTSGLSFFLSFFFEPVLIYRLACSNIPLLCLYSGLRLLLAPMGKA